MKKKAIEGWAYVKTNPWEEETRQKKGWLVDSYLGYEHRFEEVSDWHIAEFYYVEGEAETHIKFSESGEFSETTAICHDANCSPDVYKFCNEDGCPYEYSQSECSGENERLKLSGGLVCVHTNYVRRAGNVVSINGFMYLNSEDMLCFMGGLCCQDVDAPGVELEEGDAGCKFFH